MKEMDIKDFKTRPVNWDQVPSFEISEYPWYEKGLKQKTAAQIAVSGHRIYLYAKAQDKHIRARAQRLNDPVHEDSCFEFFITPWNEKSKAYFNIEINCMGTLYMAYRDEDGKKTMISQEQFGQMSIESSLKGVKDIKKETSWELKVMIPISLLEELSGREIKKDLWYGNFYRCGGEEDDQYAAWNPVKTPEPNYHQPMQFGKLRLVKWT